MKSVRARLNTSAERAQERLRQLVEERVFSRPFPRRVRLWAFGPLPVEDRHKQLAVVLGRSRVGRLIASGQIAAFVVWLCGPVYELSEDDVRTGSVVVGAVAGLIILYVAYVFRKALHQPSRAHEYIDPDPETSDPMYS
jgi:hypothetical protein